jgi:hypothetical protein
MTELVQIRYWCQETMESGRWVTTETMDKDIAEKLIESRVYERAEIVAIGMKVLAEDKLDTS